MKALVTGAAGFIGRAVVAELTTRLPPSAITAVVRTAAKRSVIEPLGVGVAIADLRDPAALAPHLDTDTVVFHLAARVAFGLHGAEPIDFESDNVTGTERLLGVCPPSLRRFVHMSSINAVERAGGDPCDHPLTEASPCHPATAYGRSKYLAELAVRRLAPERHIPFLILRPPSIVYGAGCDRRSGMAQLIQRTAAGSFLTTLDLPGRFSIIHVRDLARETVRLGLSSEFAGETFFSPTSHRGRSARCATRFAASLARRARATRCRRPPPQRPRSCWAPPFASAGCEAAPLSSADAPARSGRRQLGKGPNARRYDDDRLAGGRHPRHDGVGSERG